LPCTLSSETGLLLWLPSNSGASPRQSVSTQISKRALYQGTTSVVPQKSQTTRALAPAALFPSQIGLRGPFASSTGQAYITFAGTNKACTYQPVPTFPPTRRLHLTGDRGRRSHRKRRSWSSPISWALARSVSLLPWIERRRTTSSLRSPGYNDCRI
jgi:hypothetical protein